VRVPFIAALIALGPVFAQTATVKIRVVNSVTKSPLSGANVTVDSARGAQTHQLAGRTDTNGVFAGSVEFTGSHLLTVGHKGYRMTGTGIMGKMIEMQPGQATEITLEMRPLAVLAGRVLDQYGDPVRHAIVSTQVKSRAPMVGEYYESLFAATTDDRGEYRIAEVEPGKYYLAFEYLASDETRKPMSGQSRQFRRTRRAGASPAVGQEDWWREGVELAKFSFSSLWSLFQHKSLTGRRR
jgi:hypothetical protein